MKSGTEFFQMAVLTALSLLGITAILGVIRKRSHWDRAERVGLWLSLEIGLFAVLFALLPQPLNYTFGVEDVAWRFGSLALTMYFGFLVLTINSKQRQFGAQFPLVMRLLLAICVIFLTMELVNAVWWGSLAGYAFGVLWLVALAGIQFIAFVCYDRFDLQERYETITQNQPQTQPASATIRQHATHPPNSLAGGGGIHAHSIQSADGLRSSASTGHPNGAPNNHAYQHTTGRLPRDPNRYSNDHQSPTYGGTIADPAVRTHQNILRRGNRGNRNPNR